MPEFLTETSRLKLATFPEEGEKANDPFSCDATNAINKIELQ